MKKLLMFLCTLTLVFGIVGVAGAISYPDTYDAGGILMSGSLFGSDDSVTWTFDITDEDSGFFNPVTQDVTSAQISLSLEDHTGCFDFWEFANLDVGDNSFNWEVNTGDISFTIASLMTLSESGTVDATLTATLGDFYFNSATLTAIGTEPGSTIDDAAAPVPEPSTIMLMGTGILGLVAYGRKRYHKQA